MYESWDDYWSNKYAIKTENLIDRKVATNKHNECYGAVYRLYVLLHKLNVKG